MNRLLQAIHQRMILLVLAGFMYGSGALVHAQPQRPTHEVRVSKSHFRIVGTTNVNQFECALPDQGNVQKMLVNSSWTPNVLSFDGLHFTYPTAQCDCGNKMMNNDLRELLQADRHPRIGLKVHKIYLKPGNKSIEHLHVTADVELQMGGKTHTYKVFDGQVINLSDNSMIFKGCQQIKFSDFELAPPEKMMGLIKTRDELTVEFEIGLLVTPI